MKSLFVAYFKEGKQKRRAYFKAKNIISLIFYIHNAFKIEQLITIKKLKRIYRKTDYILEV